MDRNEVPQMVLTNDGYNSATVTASKYKESLDGISTLIMDIVVNSTTSLCVKEENIVTFFDKEPEEWKFFVIKEITHFDNPDNVMMTIYCEDYSQELIDNICRVELLGGITSLPTKITAVLSGTRWSVSTAQTPDSPSVATYTPFPESTLNKTVLGVLQMLAAQYGLHLDCNIVYAEAGITGRYVTLKSEIGRDDGYTFEYNHNISSIERVVDSTDIKTAVIPMGGLPENSPIPDVNIDIKNEVWSYPTNPANKPIGQDYLVDDSATALWGYSNPLGDKLPRYFFYKNDTITNSAELISTAWEELQKVNFPKINYKIKVIDLYATNGYNEYDWVNMRIGVGDIVNVVDRSFSITHVAITHVISREVDLLDVGSTLLELGTSFKSIVSTTSALSGMASDTNSSGSGTVVTEVAPTSLYRQAIINGNFDIWQRGISSTLGSYLADRWYNSKDATTSMTVSRQAFTAGQTVVPNNPTYFHRTAITAVGASVSETLGYCVEDVRTFAGNLCTLSFWAKASTTRVINVDITQRFGTGGSAEVISTSPTATLTTTWQKFTLFYNLASLTGKTIGTAFTHYLYLKFRFTAGTTQSVDIAQVLFNSGDTALPFYPKSFAQEMQDCLRYYEKSYDYNKYAGSVGGTNGYGLVGVATDVKWATGNVKFTVRKRIVPAVTIYHSDGTANAVGFASNNVKKPISSFGWYGESGLGYFGCTDSTFTVGQGVYGYFVADADF